MDWPSFFKPCWETLCFTVQLNQMQLKIFNICNTIPLLLADSLVVPEVQGYTAKIK